MITGGIDRPRRWRRRLLTPSLAVLAVLGTLGSVVFALRPDSSDPSPERPGSSSPTDQHHAAVVSTGVSRTTQRSGPWSSPETWADGSVPVPGDVVSIGVGHSVILGDGIAVAGLQIDGSLTLDPTRPVTIASSGSVVVTGRMAMAPADAGTEHVLRFVGVDNSAFQGAGHDFVTDAVTDVGLWVLEQGQLHLEGAARTGWTNAIGSIPAGASTIEVEDARGWRVGDELVISPTAAPSAHTNPDTTYEGFHETTIAAIDGTTVTLAAPTRTAHDEVDGRWTAEVMNLTRNVRVEASESGRAHVLVHTTGGPQLIRQVALRYLGVPGVLGRYPLHFHHAGDSSRGSLIEGVVVRQGGHHAYVPHASHGITMRDLVAYETGGGDAYWWDQGDVTNDLLMEHVISARSADGGFFLGMGWNLALRDAVSVGIANRDGNVAGFEWENGANGLWVFEDTVAHNNDNRGIRVWQNSANPQVIDGFVAYHNSGPGIEHGAYTNRYLYRDIELYGNRGGGIILQAVSRAAPEEPVEEPGITFQDMVIDAAGVAVDPHVHVQGSAIPADQPVVLRDVTFRGSSGGPLIHFLQSSQHQLRCIGCQVQSDEELVRFTQPYAPGATWLELVDADGARRLRPVQVDQGASAVTGWGSAPSLWSAPIALPVPLGAGDGVGLKAEYFDDPGLRELRYTTLLTYPIEYYWSDWGTPYPSVDTTDGAGARLSGQVEIEAGHGGRYGFETMAGGGLRLWVDGELVIDDPAGDGSERLSGAITLQAGRRYDLTMEIYDHRGGEDYFAFALAWTRPDGRREVIPTTQLHPAPGIPTNAPPVAVPAR